MDSKILFMDNQVKPAWVFLLLTSFLIGCAHQKPKPTPINPGVLTSSYDYVKPGDLSNKTQPAWILPTISKGWVPAQVDPKTNQWISGHYTATVTQEGHWATLEEAELSGKPYLRSDDTAPVIPNPRRPISSNATNQGPSPSSVSVQNQLPGSAPGMALPPPPTFKSAATKKEPAPLIIPELAPPPVVNIPPKPASSSPKTEAKKDSKVSSILSNESGEDTNAWYVAKSNEVFIRRAEAGSHFKVSTPKGDVNVTFSENGKCIVTYDGHTVSLVANADDDLLKIHLTQ